MSESERNSVFEASNILEFIIQKRIYLLIIVTTALIASILVSLVIPPKYKSTVILFPASSSSISQSLLSESFAEKDILKFGEQEEVEQMMQVLQSSEIRDRIIEKYNLIDHYKIDLNSKYPFTTLYRTYKKNVKVVRTEFMSVKVDVYDEDPEIAANIANNIADLFDSTINRMQRERSVKAFELVEHKYQEQKSLIRNMQDSIEEIHKLGVFDFESQSEVFNDQYATAIAEGNLRGANELEKKLDILAQHGSTITRLRDQLQEELKKLTVLETKYSEAKIDMEQTLPHKYVVSKAEIAERKSKPIRWLIVAISTLSAFLFALFVLLIIDSVKKK
ncbi:MAG TPA: Wzz/FepE/Etk N-terminal domain-containing protein [Bacteroidales bacterium]|nr:Wzz/FepE/Etk N-terminal domain-containing protein [Bacteroidales bacterium]